MMNMVSKILNWPANDRNNLVPWYIILRRCVAIPIMYLGFSIAWIGITIGYSFDEAYRFWRDQ